MPLIEGHYVSLMTVAVGLSLFTLVYFVTKDVILPRFSNQQRYMNAIPWVGLQEEIFSRLRGSLRAIKQIRQLASEGHTKYSKHGKPFVVPLVGRPLVILPQNKIHEYVNLPDDVVDFRAVNRESIGGDYTIHLAEDDEIHMDVVRRQLTRKLPLLTTSVYQELVHAMEELWPADTNSWLAVKTYPTCMRIVSRAANRVFGGTELCRNEEFINSSREYSEATFTAGLMISLFPNFLRPIVAPLILRRAGQQHHLDVCHKVAGPIIAKRIADVKNPPSDYKSPVDALQWLVEDCVELAKTDPTQLDPIRMTTRLLLMNTVAIHTTAMVTSNTISDIYSSPHRDDIVESLREEVDRVLEESGGVWTKQAINSMHCIDSAIKESMRFTPLTSIQLRRRIVVAEGLTLSDGIHMPQGTEIAAAGHAIHRDVETYGANAEEYDAFRFSKIRAVERVNSEEKDLVNVLAQKNSALIATSDSFVPFGHGKHACPGRFFASQQIKLFLAHLVTHYDVRLKGELPLPRELNGARIPSDDSEIELRLYQKPRIVVA